MKRPSSGAGALIILMLVTMIGVALTPLSTTPRGTTGSMDATFTEFMEPRLVALLASAREVEAMVSERSRNVLALRAESERINAIVADIDAFLTSHETTDGEVAVAEHYRDGAERIQTAINAAYDAISSFDFSAMPAMIPVFSEGANEIEAALDTLQSEAGVDSSYTDISDSRSGASRQKSGGHAA